MTTADILITILLIITIAMVALVLMFLLRRKSGSTDGSGLTTQNEDYISDAVKNIANLNKQNVESVKDTLVTLINSSNQQKSYTDEQNSKRLTDAVDKLITEQKSGYNTLEERLTRQLADIKADMLKSLTNQSMAAKQDSEILTSTLSRNMNDLLSSVNSQMDKLRSDNDAKLNQMRATVEEQLNSTLTQRINESFKVISESLDKVHNGLGQMTSLSDTVGNLNKTLSGVKTRGLWGEISLKSLLEQILVEEQYIEQAPISGGNRVDFAIKLPGVDDTPVLLPIDSKLVLDPYYALVDAAEKGDKHLVDAARKEFNDAIKKQAKSISDKYISTPKTTNFAVMYLPLEGLYAEVVRDSELFTTLQKTYKITPSGPTTLTALLNSLQLGFQTLNVQKQSAELWKALAQFRKDIVKYVSLLEKTKTNADGISKNMTEAIDRTRLINSRLSKFETNPTLSGEAVASDKTLSTALPSDDDSDTWSDDDSEATNEV